MTDINARQFRTALGDYATGVTIITALDAAGQPIGMTANSFASVSLDPPLVLWCVDENSPLYDGFLQAEHYAVHVLRDDQQEIARRFSSDDIDHFADVTYASGIARLPLLEHYSALLQCEVKSRHTEGDHVILVGRVISIKNQSAKPLLFYRGQYRRLQD